MKEARLAAQLRAAQPAGGYSIGIEEEYFVTSLETRNTTRAMSKDFMAECRAALGTVLDRELLQSQVEIATPVCETMAEARYALLAARNVLSGIARRHGLGIFAAGTHPTALWSRQRATDSARYDRLMHDLQMLGSRNMVCGMHVHVGVADPDRRVDLMVRLIPFMPLLLALSTSSPFWQGRRTGLMGYRLAAYDELPRTGLPELFKDNADYQRYVAAMTGGGAIGDESFIWWVVRPSLAHPTLELRVADSCTRVEDSLAIAALFRALVRCLDRDDAINAGMTAATRAVAVENKWRAQRYGIHGSFVDEARRSAITVGQALEETIALVRGDALALGCLAEVEGARQILKRGTSADRQLEIYRARRADGATRPQALAGVVDWLVEATAGEASRALAA